MCSVGSFYSWKPINNNSSSNSNNNNSSNNVGVTFLYLTVDMLPTSGISAIITTVYLLLTEAYPDPQLACKLILAGIS